MRRLLGPLLLALVAACAEPAEDSIAPSDAGFGEGSGTEGAFGGEPVSPALFERSFRVAAVADGRSLGFDLDRSAESSADPVCGVADAVAPDGTEGIDNGVGAVWSAFYDVVGASIESLFRDGVSRGGDVPTLLRGEAPRWAAARLAGAAVDFDGLLAGYQTFDLQGSGQPVALTETFDRIELGPWDTTVAVPSFGAPLALPVFGLRMNLQRDADGIWRGIAAGSFAVAAFPEVLGGITSLSTGEAVADALRRAADLPAPSGSCDRVSFAAQVEAVEGFAVWHTAP